MSKSPEEWDKEYRRHRRNAVLWVLAAFGFGISAIVQLIQFLSQHVRWVP